MKNMPIGILDSGIGGVTVLKEIIKLLPNEEYIYYSDSLNNPYGDKKKEEIINYVDNIIKYFINNNCKAIVIACNTATAAAIDSMRIKYPNMIFIGIEPAYKMIHDYAKTKKILVMATPSTISSNRFQKLFHKYNNKKTILLPCKSLAHLIEENETEKIEKYLIENLPTNQNIEAVVLGCTHYPIIKEEIKKVLGNVCFYDGSTGLSKQLYKLLATNNLISDSNLKITFIDSANKKEKEKRFLELLNNDIINKKES